MSSSNVEEFSADVIVIGAGGAGLPAAVRATEAGAKVILLDKRKALGGTARPAGGFFAVESPAQKRFGIRTTADELWKMHIEISNWRCDARLVHNWFNESGDMVRWLEDKGLKFYVEQAPVGSPTLVPPQPRTGHHLVDKPINTGNAIVKVLIQDCEKMGVKTFTETRAHKLLTDEKGNVTGVLATQNGKELKFTAKSIILATGTISANKELVERYLGYTYPEVLGPLTLDTGDGLLMAEEIGAGTKDALVSTHFSTPGDHKMKTSVNQIIRRPHGILVNKHGMRYADETLWALHPFQQWLAGFALDRQPSRLCYCLIDEKILRDMIAKKENIYGMERLASELHEEAGPGFEKAEGFSGSVDYKSGVPVPVLLEKVNPTGWLDKLYDDVQFYAREGKWLKKSDSWDEIAQWMGADPAVLKATIKQYNTFCAEGYDADFLKPKEWLLPLLTPPFYALKSGRGDAHAPFGGIPINHRMEVLDEEREPIGGLYAAGVGTSGWLGHGNTFGGSALGFSLYSGYAVGKIAADNAKSSGK